MHIFVHRIELCI